MKRTIEIDDTLQDSVDGAIDELKDALIEYVRDNDSDTLPDLNNDLDYDGSVHSIVGGSVPVYTHDIKSLWYLHGSKFEEAYENAGVGSNPMENDGMAAIYYYIMEKVQEWYSKEAQNVFDDLKEKMEYEAKNGLPEEK